MVIGDSAGAIYEEMARPDEKVAIIYGYCTRRKIKTRSDGICTGFYWKNDEYTPLLGCKTCEYFREENQ